MAAVQMIDVPKEPDISRTWLGSTRIARTQAHPKQSLFGTTLQKREGNVIDQLRDLNIGGDSTNIKPRSYKSKSTSPKLEAIFGQGEKSLEHTKDQIAKRQTQITRAEELLHTLEEKAKYFQVDPTTDPREIPWQRSTDGQKFTESDIHHASDINNIGQHHQSHNHRRYGADPGFNKHYIPGDPIGKGSDVRLISEKPNHLVPQMQPFKRHRDPYSVPKEQYMKHKPDMILTGTDVTIPANIRHKFGTVICDQLLCDPEKVKFSMSQENEARQRRRRPHKGMSKIQLPPQGLDPSYEEIGTSTRANLFGPGITRNHKIGTMKEDFNENIHKLRVPETDEYRYQRDELGMWWQHETIRGRLKKEWDKYEESRPTFTVNWDRDAKRPTPPPAPIEKKKPKPKPKPPPKPKEPSPKPDDIVFEDIEFVTPPLTPPVPRAPPPPPALALEDDSFWEFYNEEVPLP